MHLVGYLRPAMSEYALVRKPPNGKCRPVWSLQLLKVRQLTATVKWSGLHFTSVSADYLRH